MKKYFDILKSSPLFSGILDEELLSVLDCLNPHTKIYEKGEYVFHQGDRPESITLLAEGLIHVQKDDFWGDRSIVNVIGSGDMFGESFAADRSPLVNDVVAVEKSVVIFLDATRLLTTCSASCSHHQALIRNLLNIFAEKNRLLVQKMGYLSKKTTREKLMSYLSDEADKHNSKSFSIPFNRQQLADFLSVDRSAMSKELCKMKAEGLIEFRKSFFKLN